LLESQILDACRAKLADFKVPRKIHFVEDLPRATLGKVAKEQLRAQLRRSGSQPAIPETPRR
jgi:crotonobetaine/carnitine-CoA ligase